MGKAKRELQKTARVSADIPNENLQKLRAMFPQFVKDGAVDFDALQEFFDKEGIEMRPEKYGLSWAGKSDAFKAIRIPATGTLLPQERESKNWDTTENLFIEGDNLEALKLLQKRCSNPGKIKMIYIDPPYNTGKDFIYKDNFTENVSDYYERTGQSKDGVKLVSNPESNGRYHSDWLTMMYPRLFLARNLLRDDGVIFISIDDNEVANLRLIMDEIFGEENLICEIVREVIRGGSQSKHIRQVHDYILVYARHKESARFSGIAHDGFTLDEEDERGKFIRGRELNKWGAGSRRVDSPGMWFPILGPKGEEVYPYRNDGSEGRWRLGKKKITKLVEDGDVIFEKRENGTYVAYEKIRDDSPRYRQFTTLFLQKYTNAKGTETLKKTFSIERSYFDYVKPLELIKDLALMADVTDGEYILDFFAGSGTAACAVMDLNDEDGRNRKWICVQLPEATAENSEAYKAGYKTIAKLARARICKMGERIEESIASDMSQRQLTINAGLADKDELETREVPDVGFKSFELAKSNYRQWNVLTEKDNVEKLKAQMKLFVDKPLIDGYDERAVVYEVLLKEGFDLNSKATKEKNGTLELWRVADKERTITVTFGKKITREQVESLKLTPADIFVCFDSALDDSTKLNIARGMNVRVI